MKGPLSSGIALGLSSHSSVNAQSMFRRSQEFELSSIKKETSVRRPLCKFCGQAESFESRLIKVCTCPERCWGHEKCVQTRRDPTCQECKAPWVSKYEREMQLSNAEAASFLQSIEEGTERQRSHASSVSESSGEARMRKVIQAATLTPFCRVCGKSTDLPENKLIYPCQCYALSPQESWAHRACIRELLLHRQSDVCERCKTPFALGCVKQSACTFETAAAQCLFLVVVTTAMSGLLAFLASDEVSIETTGEEAWKWVLVALVAIVLMLLLLLAVLLVRRSKRDFIIKDVFVLCQKHEIAKITAHSHEWFEMFLAQMKAMGYIGEKLPAQRSKHKSVSSRPQIIESRDRPPQAENPAMRPVETEGFEENASSGVLQEHSVVKDSQIVLKLDPAPPSYSQPAE